MTTITFLYLFLFIFFISINRYLGLVTQKQYELLTLLLFRVIKEWLMQKPDKLLGWLDDLLGHFFIHLCTSFIYLCAALFSLLFV